MREIMGINLNTILKSINELFEKMSSGDVFGMINASKESERISKLNTEELINEFEDKIEKKYGKYAVHRVWLKREIIKRINRKE